MGIAAFFVKAAASRFAPALLAVASALILAFLTAIAVLAWQLDAANDRTGEALSSAAALESTVEVMRANERTLRGAIEEQNEKIAMLEQDAKRDQASAEENARRAMQRAEAARRADARVGNSPQEMNAWLRDLLKP